MIESPRFLGLPSTGNGQQNAAHHAHAYSQDEIDYLVRQRNAAYEDAYHMGATCHKALLGYTRNLCLCFLLGIAAGVTIAWWVMR